MRLPRRNHVVLVVGLISILVRSSTGRADQFDTIDGAVLSRAIQQKDAKPLARITLNEIAALPSLFKETRSGLLLVKTAQGNYSRVLVTPELRKPASGKGEPFPVIVLERFDTYDGANKSSRIGKGREMILFDGFQADLDTGQVVPDGQGGDLRFVAKGENAPRLETIGEARLYTPAVLPVPETGPVPQPTPGRRVVASDFSGRYRLYSNGQASGTLELKADVQGAIVGQFRSDLQGTAYSLTGQVASDSPQRVRFTIKFPRSTQEFDGYLWADGKGAMAGTVNVLERTFGFFAIREGGRIAPEGVEVSVPGAAGQAEGSALIEMAGETLIYRGKPVAPAEMLDELKKSSTARVLIKAMPDTRVAQVQLVLNRLKELGIVDVRLEVKAPADQK